MPRSNPDSKNLHTIVLAAVVLVGCSASEPFDPALVAQGRYLCTNVRFNEKGDATDANYWYAPRGETLVVGTRVVVSDVRKSSVRLRTSDSTKQYDLVFGYGRDHLSPSQYFQRVLCSEDPTEGLGNLSPEIREAIFQGRLLNGMSRRQALMARGYPPANRTPDLAADRWIYHRTRNLVDEVIFEGDEIVLVKSVRHSQID